jgi:hypothetical protein
MTYSIYEGNMPRLRKKLEPIANKCKKWGIEFKFNEVGEEYRKVRIDPNNQWSRLVTRRFVKVEVEGTAKISGWEFVGTIEHTEAGNIIRQCKTDVEIPAEWRTRAPWCEHCKSERARKDTYIVQNTDGELKQVGKSCLMAYTSGLSAERVAAYLKCFDCLAEFECEQTTGYMKEYLDTQEVLRHAIETVKHYGFISQKRKNELYEQDIEVQTTSERVTDHMAALDKDGRQTEYIVKVLQAMEKIGYDETSNEERAKAIMEWLKNAPDDNGYISNLKVLYANKWTEHRNMGLLVSVTAAYAKEVEKVEKRQKEEEKTAQSAYQGEVGDKITIESATVKCAGVTEKQVGWRMTVYTFIYKITDKSGNLYTWFASKKIEGDNGEEMIKTITGTVKDHSEYRGAKQTILTRCKVA